MDDAAINQRRRHILQELERHYCFLKPVWLLKLPEKHQCRAPKPN